MSPELLEFFSNPKVMLAMAAWAFATGACIGSFLNVVIYRVPEPGLKVSQPARSFCPNCKTQIPMWFNIPLVSWLMLMGKCKWCKKKIAFRYFMVELLTAICFFAIFQIFFLKLGFLGLIGLWILASLLIVATFIDFDHMIIPDTVTIGGCGVGLLFSALVPALHEQAGWFHGLKAGLIGAALGFFLLWGILRLGKLIFGQIKHEFEKPIDFKISQPNEEEPIKIQFGKDITHDWDDVFHRSTDRMDMEITELRFNGEKQKLESGKLRVVEEGFILDGDRTELEDVKKVTGKVTKAVVPREAMGFGDVKFIAMIGAFLGWKAVLITIMAASVSGAIIGMTQKMLSKESRIPFGPYLALGAFICLFTGAALWNWYTGLLVRR